MEDPIIADRDPTETEIRIKQIDPLYHAREVLLRYRSTTYPHRKQLQAEGRHLAALGLSTDIRNWTLFDIENWTPGLCDVAPRLSRSGLSR